VCRLIARPSRCTLSPYTTLFRSLERPEDRPLRRGVGEHPDRAPPGDVGGVPHALRVVCRARRRHTLPIGAGAAGGGHELLAPGGAPLGKIFWGEPHLRRVMPPRAGGRG